MISLVDARRTRTRKEPKQQSKDVGERRQKRKREDSKEDKLQPRNTVSQKDFEGTKIQE
jgi:hypothetical protein